MVIVKKVEKGSVSYKNGVLPDDILMAVNGHEINDVLDYRFYLADNSVSLTFKRGDSLYSVVLKNHGSSDIGLEFDTPLMDKKRRCANECIFCFIDQNPEGMRETIYFKDDDSRLSFLHGNYITLTNLSQKDVDRIIKMRSSPVRVSVHTTNPELRCEMMKNRRAGEVLGYLKDFSDAGLEINAQIVLCRGYNDKDELLRTMTDLEKYCPALTSCSIVPVGLTKHRSGLTSIEPFSKDDAKDVINMVNTFGNGCKDRYGSRIFFVADEFYLKAGVEIPSEDYYEDYSQIENGVGMLRSFEEDFKYELKNSKYRQNEKRTVSVATGVASFDTVSRLCKEASGENLKINVYCIKNDFYGENVTVSGLLTGSDIINQLSGHDLGDELLVPRNAVRREEKDFLDGVTVDAMSETLGVKVTPSGEDGTDFLHRLLGK